MKKTVYGGKMSTRENHSNIALVSMIIKDGIKNYDELIKKFAACKNYSKEKTYKIINKMKNDGEIGYYHSKFSHEDGTFIYYFTRWTPAEKFPEKKEYQSKAYFRPYFRKGLGEAVKIEKI